MGIFCSTAVILAGETLTQRMNSLRKVIEAYYGVGADGKLLFAPLSAFRYLGALEAYRWLDRRIDMTDAARLAEEVVWRFPRLEEGMKKHLW